MWGTHPKVLACSGSRRTLEVVTVALRRFGRNVVRCHDPLSLVDIARAERPECVVLDISCPESGTRSALEELRTDKGTKRIRVILLGPASPPDWVRPYLQSSAVRYAGGPIDAEDLWLEADGMGPMSKLMQMIPGGGDIEELLAAKPAAATHRHTIALICADANWRKRARKALRHARHVVDAYGSAKAALEGMGDTSPDRIILLPFCDALAESVRDCLKTHPPTCHVQVLMPRDEESFLRLVNTLGKVRSPAP